MIFNFYSKLFKFTSLKKIKRFYLAELYIFIVILIILLNVYNYGIMNKNIKKIILIFLSSNYRIVILYTLNHEFNYLLDAFLVMIFEYLKKSSIIGGLL